MAAFLLTATLLTVTSSYPPKALKPHPAWKQTVRESRTWWDGARDLALHGKEPAKVGHVSTPICFTSDPVCEQQPFPWSFIAGRPTPGCHADARRKVVCPITHPTRIHAEHGAPRSTTNGGSVIFVRNHKDFNIFALGSPLATGRK